MISVPSLALREEELDGVRTSLLAPGQLLPLILQPLGSVDLAVWAAKHRDWLDARLLIHGAILFRGFGTTSEPAFEQAAQAACGELFAEYGDLPRNAAGERSYESTPYPNDQMILWHNESAHFNNWPMRINFCCLVAPKVGGCTPIIDTRGLMKQLDAHVIDAFRQRGLLYIRNFSDNVSPTWQEFFHTANTKSVEKMCLEAGYEFEWRPQGSLRLRQRTHGVARHPQTGEELFFNQVQHHHPACLDDETREGMELLYDPEDFPRNVTFGDGTPIPDDMLHHIGEVYENVCVRFTWETGDYIMLDNMMTSHARDPFEGERRIIVALAQMMYADSQSA